MSRRCANGGRFFRSRTRVSRGVGAVAGGGLSVVSLGIATFVYGLPMRAWPLCFAVGAAMGAYLGRSEPTASR